MLLDPNGKPYLRIAGDRAPCRYDDAICPKGSPEHSRALTPENQQVYRHYKECKATGNFPDDPLVAIHAGIIREVEDVIAEARQDTMVSFMGALRFKT